MSDTESVTAELVELRAKFGALRDSYERLSREGDTERWLAAEADISNVMRVLRTIVTAWDAHHRWPTGDNAKKLAGAIQAAREMRDGGDWQTLVPPLAAQKIGGSE